MKNHFMWGAVLALLASVVVMIGAFRSGGSPPPKRIAVIPRETSSAYWQKFRKGAVEAAEEESLEILWDGPGIAADRDSQMRIVQDAIARNVNGVLLSPYDREVLTPLVEYALAGKVPCVIVDSDIDTSRYIAFKGPDNRKGGVLAARRFSRILEGTGRIIILEWPGDSNLTDARIAAFRETLAGEFSEIEIAGSKGPDQPTLEEAMEVTETLLAAHADARGIFACNATTTAAALQTLRSAEHACRDIRLVGFDAWPLLVGALETGEIDSLIVRNPHKMGFEGVKTIAAMLRGRDVPQELDPCIELITAERLGEPQVMSLLNGP